MKTFKITVPYTYMVSGEFTHKVDEDQVLEYFEVNSLDKIDPEDLEEYLREQADDATGDISDDEICELVREQKGLETDIDNCEIEVEVLEAAE